MSKPRTMYGKITMISPDGGSLTISNLARNECPIHDPASRDGLLIDILRTAYYMIGEAAWEDCILRCREQIEEAKNAD